MERPGSITVVAAGLALLSVVTGVLGIVTGPGTGSVGTQVFIGINVLLGLVILYHFWLGRNWARILVMLQSGFVILNALMASRVSHVTYLYMIGMAAVSVFLLFYLNRPDIRAWFSLQSVKQ